MIRLIIILCLFFITNAEAYFDPGSGAFVVQAIIAFFSVILFYMGYPIRMIRKFISYIKNKFSKKKDKDSN